MKGVDCQLMTSHLESTKTSADERKRQLKIALEKMRTGDSTKTIIFGGDLNLRDKEVTLYTLIIWTIIFGGDLNLRDKEVILFTLIIGPLFSVKI